MKKLADKTEVVRFQDLVDKLKKKAKDLSTNPRYVKDTLNLTYSVLEKLEKLKQKKFVQVELRIPEELVEKLGKGKIFRVGEIIKQKENHSLVKLLVETKPSNVKKLLKTRNIAFKTVDLMESLLLDQKLEEIIGKVEEIDRKLDAQNKGALKSAVRQMKELPLIQNPDTRKSKILFIQDKLSHCEHVLGELYESNWYRYKALKSNFEKSLISNRKELKEMCEIGEKLPGELEPIILCKFGQVKLYEMQEEFVLAQEKAFDTVKYVSEKLEDFKNEFSESSLDRKNENYKNPADFNKKKTLLKLKDQLVEPNEYIEYLLNTTLSFAMTVPEEVSVEGGESKGFWSKIFSWIKRLFLFK
ncbi:MAG: hypothetical protein JSV88_03575 [Candidatus Aminicenantes bacterium]|nr:MAG: hypothetical protein JSV88_03575 [Candidatus Aminicenantes bacterium]